MHEDGICKLYPITAHLIDIWRRNTGALCWQREKKYFLFGSFKLSNVLWRTHIFCILEAQSVLSRNVTLSSSSRLPPPSLLFCEVNIIPLAILLWLDFLIICNHVTDTSTLKVHFSRKGGTDERSNVFIVK